MFDEVPMAVWQALQDDIEKRDLEYADNYRAYRVSDDFLRAEFDEAERHGCCGFFYSSIVIDGKEWIYACNYGH